MKKTFPYIAVITAMIIWAGSGIAVKAALEALAPLTLVLTRFTIGVLLMLVVGLIANQTTPSNSILRLQKVDRQDIWLFILGGVFQPFLYFILETYSYKLFATPTIAEAFLSTNPLIAPIFALIFLREKVTFWNVLGILVSTGGMILLVLAGSGSFELGSLWAIPLALITVCMAAAYSIILKKVPEKYSSLTIVFWVQLAGLLLFYVVAGGKALIHPDAQWLVGTLSGGAISGVAYLAALSSVAAFILFCYSVRYLGVTKANIFNNIRPVFTALIMLMFFQEQLPIWKWVGIAIIVLGLFICQKQTKNQ
ncbi:MAG: EamA family transporter [Paludibacteraceae bacterium]|nr:EamA family transporter [Paludibacteraceae bacterium]